MKSLFASILVSQEIWSDFTAHFKSKTTKGSYQTDISEIMDYFEKDFLAISEDEVREYFTLLKNKVMDGRLKPGTMAKKFRELHSFAEYICENREKYYVPEEYQDYYYPYLKLVAKQEKFVRSIPIEHIDKLLLASEGDSMVYSILTLLYRAGFTSTQIIELKPEDFGVYENGVYVHVKGREEACYIPEDAVLVLNTYMSARQANPYLFYNKRGNKLNTMYISRMMQNYCRKAGIPSYSAESLRNTCGVTLYAYGAKDGQVAGQFGNTQIQIKRYKDISYKESLLKKANQLVKVKVLPPEI